MDPDSGTSASDWLAAVDERELKQVLRKFGEENNAARIARAIVGAREAAPISRTAQLARIVEEASPKRGRKIHPATKTFQAIRIAINGELKQLEAVLAQSVNVMRKGGRLCVISFHSLEDRIVKHYFVDCENPCTCPRDLPECACGKEPTLRVVTRKIVKPRYAEIETNSRARSAKLRVAEKLEPAN